jgi:hypothetical protein
VTDATTGKVLVEGTDYTLSYSDDTTDVGTVTATVTGIGDYAGTVDRTYKITPAPLTVTTPDATKAYDGGALTAAGTLSGLVTGETATFSTTGTQTEAGSSTNTYALTWDGTAKASNYAVTETLGTLTVTKADLTDAARFTVSQPADVTYDGLSQRQPLTVTDATTGKVLVEGTDYTLSYSYDTTDVGTVTATVTGIGDYAGTVDRTYKITPALTVTTPRHLAYDGGALTAAGTLSGLVPGETATFSTTGTQTEAGSSTNTYALTWDGTAKSSNYAVTETLGTLTVTKADAAQNAVTVTPYAGTYDGSAHTVSATAAQVGSTLLYSTDGQTWSETAPTWTDVTSAQTVHVKATNPNYGDATADGTVTITPAALTVTTPDATKAYDGGALTAAGTLSGLVPGETATFSTTGTQTEAGSSTNTYALTWDGSAKASNYTVTETLGTLTVTAAPATPVVPGDTTPTTPTGTTPTTPVTPASTTPVAAVVTPIATALQNAYQAAIGEEPTPLSTPSTAEEESIDENGTPLATAAEPVCWVHWYIMLGMLVTLVYGLVVLFRRRRYTKGLKNREKRVLREDDDQQDKQGESAPTIPSGAEA